MPCRLAGTVLFLVAFRLFAQFDSGQIAGFVKDPSDAVVARASVTVRNENTGEQRRTRTDESGYYVFPNLVVGTYMVTTEHPGFKKSVQTGITLSSAVRLSIDVPLTVGSVSDTVQVEATAGLVQAESAVVGRTINSEQVADLTLNGRNPIYLCPIETRRARGIDSERSTPTACPTEVSASTETTRRIPGHGRRRRCHPDAIIGFHAGVARRRHHRRSSDSDSELQRRVWPVVGRTDPLCDEERRARLPRKPGGELSQFSAERKHLDA